MVVKITDVLGKFSTNLPFVSVSAKSNHVSGGWFASLPGKVIPQFVILVRADQSIAFHPCPRNTIDLREEAMEGFWKIMVTLVTLGLFLRLCKFPEVAAYRVSANDEQSDRLHDSGNLVL